MIYYRRFLSFVVIDLPPSLLEKRNPPLKTLFHPDAFAKRVPWNRSTGNQKEELTISDH